jgi:hypothetical protein
MHWERVKGYREELEGPPGDEHNAMFPDYGIGQRREKTNVSHVDILAEAHVDKVAL